MKKQIALAIFLLTASPLLAMEQEELGKKEGESVEQKSQYSQFHLCAFLESLDALSNRAARTVRAMEIRKKVDGVIKMLSDALAIDYDQDPQLNTLRQSDEDEDAKDPEGEKLNQLEADLKLAEELQKLEEGGLRIE